MGKNTCTNCNDKGCTVCGVMSRNDKTRALFLTTMGPVLERHNLSWQDVDINWDTGVIDFRVDIDTMEIVHFLTDLDKATGGYD